MEQIQILFADLKKALIRLEETQDFPDEQAFHDATIQRFEFTFELSWKLMQSVAIQNGITAYGPRNAIRAAVRLNLIDGPEKWLDFLDDRNTTTHVYKEETAEAVYQRVPNFIPLVGNLVLGVENYLKSISDTKN